MLILLWGPHSAEGPRTDAPRTLHSCLQALQLVSICMGEVLSGAVACHAGAVQFLFRLPDGTRYVHCGDMRYCPAMQNNAQLQGFVGADAVFLDTTYCKGKHQFPPQVRHCSRYI